LAGVLGAGEESRNVDVISGVVGSGDATDLLATIIGDDNVLSGLKSEDAVFASVVGLRSRTAHHLRALPLVTYAEHLHVSFDYRVSVLIADRPGDDARRAASETRYLSRALQGRAPVFSSSGVALAGRKFVAGIRSPRRSTRIDLVRDR